MWERRGNGAGSEKAWFCREALALVIWVAKSALSLFGNCNWKVAHGKTLSKSRSFSPAKGGLKLAHVVSSNAQPRHAGSQGWTR
jgi:hypothetical protein